MHRVMISLAVVVFACVPVLASDESDALAPVQQFCDGFNKNQPELSIAACEQHVCIIDDVPPYQWHGTDGLARWMSDYDADAKKRDISGGNVALGKPKHITVAGEDAYVVVPTTYTYTMAGKQVKETAVLTAALHKGEAGWRIAAWSWAKD